MREAVEAWSKADEFAGIFMTDGRPRAVMSKPPRMQASKAFIREVQDLLDASTSTEEVADWIVNKMEDYGAHLAEPMFDMNGNGPACSFCKTLWPLCGHQHVSQRLKELESEADQ